MKTKIFLYLAFFFSLALLSACSEDDTLPQSEAAFTASKTTAQIDEVIQFTNTSQNATAFRWSFGDGTTSKEISPRKSYGVSGTYTVSLVSTGEGGATISNMEITITPAASFNVENEDDLYVLTPVTFVNTSKGATSYTWNFGDAGNSTSSVTNPQFTYTTDGVYTVRLTATSAGGTSTIEKQITIKASLSPDLFFIEYGSSPVFIRKMALDGTGTITNFLDINDKEGICMTYNENTDKIYFSDSKVSGSGKIWSVNIDGTELTEIASGLYIPYDLAVDKINNKIYWVDEADDDDMGHIYRANLDGSNRETVLTMEGAQFRAISLDPQNNKMYFFEVYDENLHVANLDGTNESILISGAWGYGLLVDTQNQKIYYEDNRILKRANLDGTGIIIIDDNTKTPTTTQTRIYGMAIDNEAGKFYWSGRDNSSIISINLDGTNKVMLKTGLSSPRGLFLRK